jgi:hypothetical protein
VYAEERPPREGRDWRGCLGRKLPRRTPTSLRLRPGVGDRVRVIETPVRRLQRVEVLERD